MIERDRASELSRLTSVRALRDGHVDIQNRADAFHPDCRLGDGAAHLGEVPDRLEKILEVGKEDGERSDRHRGGEDEQTAPPEDEADAQRYDHRDDRRQERLYPPGLQGGLDLRATRIRQVPLLQLLSPECIHHSDRLEPLLHDTHDVALPTPDFAGRLFDLLPEPRDKEQKDWRHGHGDKREVPVEPEHQAEHPDHRQNIDQDA